MDDASRRRREPTLFTTADPTTWHNSRTPYKDDKARWPTISQALSPEQRSSERRRRHDGMVKFDAPCPGRPPTKGADPDHSARRLQGDFDGLDIMDGEPMNEDMGIPIKVLRQQQTEARKTTAPAMPARTPKLPSSQSGGLGACAGVNTDGDAGTADKDQDRTGRRKRKKAEGATTQYKDNDKRLDPADYSTCYTCIWCKSKKQYASEAALASH